jgi:hypothetical protein
VTWWGPLVGGVGVVLGWVGPVGCPWWGSLVLGSFYVAVWHVRGAPPPLREGVLWCFFLLFIWRWPVVPSVSKKKKKKKNLMIYIYIYIYMFNVCPLYPHDGVKARARPIDMSSSPNRSIVAKRHYIASRAGITYFGGNWLVSVLTNVHFPLIFCP